MNNSEQQYNRICKTFVDAADHKSNQSELRSIIQSLAAYATALDNARRSEIAIVQHLFGVIREQQQVIESLENFAEHWGAEYMMWSTDRGAQGIKPIGGDAFLAGGGTLDTGRATSKGCAGNSYILRTAQGLQTD